MPLQTVQIAARLAGHAVAAVTGHEYAIADDDGARGTGTGQLDAPRDAGVVTPRERQSFLGGRRGAHAARSAELRPIGPLTPTPLPRGERGRGEGGAQPGRYQHGQGERSAQAGHDRSPRMRANPLAGQHKQPFADKQGAAGDFAHLAAIPASASLSLAAENPSRPVRTSADRWG